MGQVISLLAERLSLLGTHVYFDFFCHSRKRIAKYTKGYLAKIWRLYRPRAHVVQKQTRKCHLALFCLRSLVSIAKINDTERSYIRSYSSSFLQFLCKSTLHMNMLLDK